MTWGGPLTRGIAAGAYMPAHCHSTSEPSVPLCLCGATFTRALTPSPAPAGRGEALTPSPAPAGSGEALTPGPAPAEGGDCFGCQRARAMPSTSEPFVSLCLCGATFTRAPAQCHPPANPSCLCAFVVQPSPARPRNAIHQRTLRVFVPLWCNLHPRARAMPSTSEPFVSLCLCGATFTRAMSAA